MTTKNFVVKNGLTTGNIILDASSSNITANVVVANLSVPSFANLGLISNVKITGGSTGQLLVTDGTGNLSWSTISIPSSYSNANVAAYLPTYTGNISANYYLGNGSQLTSLNGSTVSGNVSQAVHSYFADTANSITGSNVTGNVPQAVHAYFADTANSITGSNVTGNVPQAVHAYFADTANSIAGSGITGNVPQAVHAYYADVANSIVGTNVSGNVSQAVHSYYSDVANSIAGSNVSGNVSQSVHAYFADTANAIAGSGVSGNVLQAVHSYYSDVANSVTGSNVSGQVSNALIAGTVYTNSQPNITSVGTLTGLTVLGDITINGNLTITGNYEYVNVTTLNIKDPVIEQGGNPNGVALASNDGFDRGQILHYYTTAPVDAFMGWKNSSGEFVFASNASVSGNVATVNKYGNVHAGYFIGNGSQLTGLPESYTNSNVAAYLPTYTGLIGGTLSTAAQPNITSVGTLTSLSVTGNISGNYFVGNGSLLTGLPSSYANSNIAAYLPTYTGNISANYYSGNGSQLASLTGANVIGNVSQAVHSYFADVANSIVGSNVTGNVSQSVHSYFADVANSVTGSNVTGNVSQSVHSYFADVANSIVGSNVSGQVSNALIAGTVYTNSQPNITSVGTLTSLAVTGNVSGNYFIGNGSQLTGLPAGYANSNVSAYLPTYSGLVGGILSTAAQPNITSVGTLTSLSVTGNVSGNYFIGNGSILTSITGANVTGNVSQAVHAYYSDVANSITGSNVSGQVSNALIAGTVYTNSQPNITSVGTLTGLTSSGIIVATGTGGIKVGNIQDPIGTNTIVLLNSNVSMVGNLTVGTGGIGNVTATYFIGNGSQLTGIAGTYSNATVASYLPTYTGNITAGNITTTGLETVGNLIVNTSANLGSNANVKITGGTTGQYLKTDGTGNLSWATVSGGGGGGTGITYTAALTPPGTANVADQWFNTTTNVLYEYMSDGTASYWVDIATPTSSSLVTSNYVNRNYTGDNTTTTYTVTLGCGVNDVLVFLNGVCQSPTLDYAISGTVLTLDAAPISGTRIQIRELPR